MADDHDNRPAFPQPLVRGRYPGSAMLEHTEIPGITAREHAAIALRVPDSGQMWLDAMIRESRRWDAAERIMPGLVSNLENLGALRTIGAANGLSAEDVAARGARSFADALLSVLSKMED
jgi:hypothetical protein